MTKAKNVGRRAERERAFQVLYGLSFTPARSQAELRRAYSRTPDKNVGGDEMHREPAGFAWELVEGVWINTARLDAALGRFSHNWRVDRMGRIELTLLRLALFEILYRDDVPPKVAINEALELSVRFGESTAKNFINGILDAAVKSLHKGSADNSATPHA